MHEASSNSGLRNLMKRESDKDKTYWPFADLLLRPPKLWREPGHIPGFLLSRKIITRTQSAFESFQKFPVSCYWFYGMLLLMVMQSALSTLACLLCAGTLLVSASTVLPVLMRY
jgi:hypothetical protein